MPAAEEDVLSDARNWLVLPAPAAQPGIVRLWVRIGSGLADGLCKAYQLDHPQVQFKCLNASEAAWSKALIPETDLLVTEGRLSPADQKELATFGKAPEEKVLGSRPLLVLAHPENPLASLTLEQVQHVASHTICPWKEIGVDRPGAVAKIILGSRQARDAVGVELNAVDSPRPSTQEADVARRAARYDLIKFYQEADAFAAASTQPDSLTFCPATEAARSSGLKALKIAATRGDDPAEPSPANVASGRYPLRLCYCLTSMPHANAAAKDFAQWLQSPAAAKILAGREVYGLLNVPAIAGATTQPGRAAPPVGPAGPVAGAVAVMPAAMLSPFYVMARTAHFDAYEQAITDALAADGRLKLVDRTELRRVFAERQYQLLGADCKTDALAPIVSADVFVMPSLVTEDSQPMLRVQAWHTATASLLAELKLPIDPARPAELATSLPDAVRRWWPGVLTRLTHTRTRPVWSFAGVFPASGDGVAPATQAETVLRKSLADRSDIFLAGYAELDDASGEVLMASIGASRSVGGPLSPAAQFVVQGRIGDDGRLELAILPDTGGRQLATATFAAVDLAAAVRWLDAQTAAAASKPPPSAGKDGDWAVQQSKAELGRFKALGEATAAFARQADLRRIENGLTQLLPEDQARLDDLARARRAAGARAYHLDPASEPAMAAAIDACPVGGPWGSRARQSRLRKEYVERFPSSPRWRGEAEFVIGDHMGMYHYLLRESVAGRAQGLLADRDCRKLAVGHLKKGEALLRGYALRFAATYDDPRMRLGCWNGFQGLMAGYPVAFAEYCVLADVPADEAEGIIRRWSAAFDAHPKAGPHSDFLRLVLLAERNDRKGVLAKLNEMQQAHPDPKDAYWQNMVNCNWLIDRLFNIADRAKSTFWQWQHGKHGIGDLPVPGYNPNDDKTAPGRREWDPVRG